MRDIDDDADRDPGYDRCDECGGRVSATTDCCVQCGLHHGDQCPACGGRGLHLDGCSEADG